MKKLLLKLVLMTFFLSFGSFSVKLSAVNEANRLERQANESYEEDEREYWLFVGNPGVGKSTLINSLAGENLAPAGVSIGTGLTKFFKAYTHGNKIYLDTPGLADISLREQAAEEIEKALKHHGRYKIFFIITLEAGRVRDSDVATINTIMEAIKLERIEFNIIVNKVNLEEKEALEHPTAQAIAFGSLNSGKYKTTNIYYIDLSLEILMRQKKLVDIDPKLADFFQTVSKGIFIPREKVEAVNSQDFEQITQVFNNQMAELREIIQKDQKMQEDLLDQINNMRKELAAAEAARKQAEADARAARNAEASAEVARKKAEESSCNLL